MNGVRQVHVDGSPLAIAELTGALRAALDGRGPAVIPVAGGGSVAAGLLAESTPLESGIALVVPTSGSTGQAKAVLLSVAALRASASATHDRLGGPGRWLLALPVEHIAGIQVLVRSILAGRDAVLMDTTTGFRPQAFAAAAAAVLGLAGPHYTALVPTQLSRLVTDGGAGLAALRRFDAVLVGGAAAPTPLLARALDAGVRVVTTYGMTETAGGCVYDRIALPGVGMRIGGGGLIELSGPMLADGYWAMPQETAAAFAGGWFHTADRGRLDSAGRLEVLGRADDVINTGGLKIAPGAVEQVLAAQPGVAEVCVVGLADPEWGEALAAVVVPSAAGHPPPAESLRAVVRQALGAPAVPKLVRFVDELPTCGPGKVDRASVRVALSGPV
jgi:O-succinylbenzoic acid--CoA ligase